METAIDWDKIFFEGKCFLMELPDIEVPMIAAVNGPARIHAEIPVLCDIVLASEDAIFQDLPHFINGTVAGYGVHLVWPLLLGLNRGRYVLLTGQELSAQQALSLGVVNEVLARDRMLARAWQLAEKIAGQPMPTRRYTRSAVVQEVKRLMIDRLRHGPAIEGLGIRERERSSTGCVGPQAGVR